MKRNPLSMTMGTVALCIALSLGQTQEASKEKVVFETTFEEGVAGWQGMGPKASVRHVIEAGKAKSGKGALEFAYPVEKGGMNVLLLPTPAGDLAKMKSLRFWIKADYATTLAVSVQEKGGGSYVTFFYAPANTWQQVVVDPEDLALSAGKDDPKDANGKLDFDKAEAVSIMDFAQFFIQTEDANFRALFAVKEGNHTLLLDDFAALDSVATPPTAEKNSVWLETYSQPQLNWLTVGGVQMTPTKEKPLSELGVKVSYSVAPGKLGAWARRFPTGKLKGMDLLGLTLASSKPNQLTIQVEEDGGGKYNTTLTLPGDREAREYLLRFADFKPADDSMDDNGKLDLERVQQITILDITGIVGATTMDIELWMGRIRGAAMK